MAAKKSKGKAQDNIKEEYYQISVEILSSFSKYRPPVDLFKFDESIAVLAPYSKKGQRITNEQIEEIQRLCAEEILFVSRSDHHIYSEHIVNQLDLVLQDANLKESEIANICCKALGIKYGNFIQQPLIDNFDLLFKDLLVFTEFIVQDKHRIKLFIRRINYEHNLINHSLNCLFLGLWLWMETTTEYQRSTLDRVALGLLLHDIGMSKIPPFLISKRNALNQEERDKIKTHTVVGYGILKKLNIDYSEVTKAIVEHHERCNGSGYPRALKGDDISKIGRVTAIVDCFSAMVSTKAYAEPKKLTEAANELFNDRVRYDPTLTAKFYTAISTEAFGPIPELKKGK